MKPTRIDFYLLTAASVQDVRLFACKLMEKAYERGHKLFVYCRDEAEAQTLDELLWTFKEDSFIPHNLQGEGPTAPPPIQLGFGNNCPRNFRDILLNLAPTIPSFYTQFNRVIEIVPNDEEQKKVSRSHFATYKQAGIEITTHNIA